MSGIAWVMLKNDYSISGSDLQPNRLTERLEENGAQIFIGHHAANVSTKGAVVISTAIRPDNPELVAAREQGLPVVHRADALDEIMRRGRSVAVAGTHGKTTTTSMMVMAAIRCGLDPTVLIGGELNDIGGNAKVGKSDLVIAEADESDGSFLKYQPHFSIVTNTEPDHLDYYGDEKAVAKAYLQFINQTRPEGCAVLCKDDPLIRASLKEIQAPVLTYGIMNEDVDFFATQLDFGRDGCSYDLYVRGEKAARVNLKVQGAFNASNSLAVLAVCDLLGADRDQAVDALENFDGVIRRFQIKGHTRGITVIDDYAHHPTEVRVTLKSARAYCHNHDGHRVVGIFQPHRYSRTHHLSREFGQAFEDAQEVIITDIYAAGEAPMEGVSGRLIYESVQRAGHPNVSYIPAKDQVVDFLADHLAEGDMVLTLGAGDIWKVGEDLLDQLNQPATP